MKRDTPFDGRKSSASAANREHECTAATDIPPRRIMLRGALVAGCSLLMPAALLGCDAGKEQAGANGNDSAVPLADPATSGLSSPAPDAESAAPAMPEKVSKASVQYQTQPQGEQNCASCMHFIVESNTCQKVAGDISPLGWCVLWAKGDLSRGDQRNGKPATRPA